MQLISNAGTKNNTDKNGAEGSRNIPIEKKKLPTFNKSNLSFELFFVLNKFIFLMKTSKNLVFKILKL